MRARLLQAAAPWGLGVLVAVASVPTSQDLTRPAVLALALASAAAAGTARRRLLPLLVVAAAGWAWWGLWPAVVVASYYAGTRPWPWARLVAYVGSAVVLVALPPLVPAVADPRVGSGAGNAVALAGLLVLLPVTSGLWVGARRRVLEGLRQRAEQLEREQAALAERERAVERARIARDMHDVVAHRVSLMVVQAGALEVRTTDAATAQAAGTIRVLGREALTDLRDVLGVLRQPGDGQPTAPPPGLADLGPLLARSRTAGTQVSWHEEGAPSRPLPAAVQTTAYLVVQEGLANVHRHAAGAPTAVRLHHQEQDLEVEVTNDRPGRHPAATRSVDLSMPTSGHGLTGLRERLALLGGQLDAGPRATGGFRLAARIPHPDRAEAP